MPDVCLFSVKKPLGTILRNGAEVPGLFFKASTFRRDGDLLIADITHVFADERWRDVREKQQLIIPIDNMAGWSWHAADEPIVNGSVDLEALRKLVATPPKEAV